MTTPRGTCPTCRWLEPGTHKWRRCEYPVDQIQVPAMFRIEPQTPCTIQMSRPPENCPTFEPRAVSAGAGV
jgi:hypothetical protein